MTRTVFTAAIIIALCEAAGVIGALSTSADSTWHLALHKPPLMPPGWLFAPVWVALYALMGLAAALVWQAATTKTRGESLSLFAIQLFLNVAWSWLFFGVHSLAAAAWEIVLLWLAILAVLFDFSRTSRLAAWLLAPYLAWVTFAMYLAFSILLLN